MIGYLLVYLLMGVTKMELIIVYNLGDGHLDPAEAGQEGSQSPWQSMPHAVKKCGGESESLVTHVIVSREGEKTVPRL